MTIYAWYWKQQGNNFSLLQHKIYTLVLLVVLKIIWTFEQDPESYLRTTLIKIKVH